MSGCTQCPGGEYTCGKCGRTYTDDGGDAGPRVHCADPAHHQAVGLLLSMPPVGVVRRDGDLLRLDGHIVAMSSSAEALLQAAQALAVYHFLVNEEQEEARERARLHALADRLHLANARAAGEQGIDAQWLAIAREAMEWHLEQVEEDQEP